MTATPEPADARGGDSVWPALLHTLAAQTIGMMILLVPAAVAPSAAAALGLGPHWVWSQVAAAYAGAALSSAIAGTLTRRWGAVAATQVGLALEIAGAAALTLPHLSAVIAGSALAGIGYGLLGPAASHLLARHLGHPRATLIFSFRQTGVPLGGALAGLVAPPLTAIAPWWAGALVGAGLAAASALLIGRRRAAWDQDRDPRRPLGLRALEGMALTWRVRPLRWIAAMGFAYASVQVSVSGFLTTALVQDLGRDLVAAGQILAATQLAGVAGRMMSAALADRMRAGLAVLAGMGAAMTALALGVTALTPTSPGWLSTALFVALGLTALGWNGVFVAETARAAPPGLVGPASGGALSVTFFGVMLTTPWFGWMAGTLGSTLDAYFVSAAFAALGMVAAAAAGRASPRAA